MGLMCIGLAQYWRAGVDTAELTQQILGVAREQLQVSQQALSAGGLSPQSFADVKVEPQIEAAKSVAKAKNDLPAEHSKSVKPKPLPKGGKEHMGHRIEEKDGVYIVEGRNFKDLSQAERFINLNLLPKKTAKKRSKSIS